MFIREADGMSNGTEERGLVVAYKVWSYKQ